MGERNSTPDIYDTCKYTQFKLSVGKCINHNEITVEVVFRSGIFIPLGLSRFFYR